MVKFFNRFTLFKHGTIRTEIKLNILEDVEESLFYHLSDNSINLSMLGHSRFYNGDEWDYNSIIVHSSKKLEV